MNEIYINLKKDNEIFTIAITTNKKHILKQYINEGYVSTNTGKHGHKGFVTEILDLLQNTKMSCNQIAKCFNIDLQTVYIINNGQAKRYRRDGFTYPARPHN